MVRPSLRSSFTGVEYSFASLFELCNYILAIIFNKPDQFKWIAVISWCAVAVSTVCYAGWVWKERGHLVHWEKLGMMGKGCECVGVRLGYRGGRTVWRRVGDEVRDEE
jgi:iron-regulated transporter 1